MKTINITNLSELFNVDHWKTAESIKAIEQNLENGYRVAVMVPREHWRGKESLTYFKLHNPKLSPVVFSVQRQFGSYSLGSNYRSFPGKGKDQGTGARLVDEFDGVLGSNPPQSNTFHKQRTVDQYPPSNYKSLEDACDCTILKYVEIIKEA